MFQLWELRKHQLVEAHIRLYVIKHKFNDAIESPNDELGTMLLVMLPEIVVPEIDISSPLMPPPLRISPRTGEIVP
jgi:hypothetical protein